MNPTPLDLFLRACFLGLSLILLLVSLAAFRRARNARMAMVGAAFALYLALALLSLLSSFIGLEEFELSAPVVLLQLVVLSLLYLALLKR